MTDCIFKEIGDGFVVALNKRTKASEPYISEIVQYAAKSFKVLGRAIRNHTTVRHLEQVSAKFLAAFTMTYILIYKLGDLVQVQKIQFKSLTISGVLQNGESNYNKDGVILCFYDNFQR